MKVRKNYKQASLGKQLPFARAMALTRTAKDVQKEIISNGLPGAFTVRGNWFLPRNAFGVKVTAATKTNPVAKVGTNADWIEIHETGGTKRPAGASLAVPTAEVKRNKKDIIARSQRPRALRDAFVINTRKGRLLVRRTYMNRSGNFTGRKLKKSLGSRLQVLYGLEPSVKIRKRSGFIAPAKKEIDRRLMKNFMDSLEFAFRTAR